MSKRRLIDLAYAGYLAVFCLAALVAGGFLVGREAAATLMEFLTIVLFPLAILIVLLALTGFAAGIAVVRWDWRPLALWGFLWLGAGLFETLEGFRPSRFVTPLALLQLAVYVAASAYYAWRWFGKERNQFA